MKRAAIAALLLALPLAAAAGEQGHQQRGVSAAIEQPAVKAHGLGAVYHGVGKWVRELRSGVKHVKPGRCKA